MYSLVPLFMGAYFIKTRSRGRKFLGEFAPGSKSSRVAKSKEQKSPLYFANSGVAMRSAALGEWHSPPRTRLPRE